MYIPKTKRILTVCGHYGSGKTEAAVSLAFARRRANPEIPLAIVDLDIVNPYFRSRERRDELARVGVQVYGSIYKGDIAAEIPALGADAKTPIENPDTDVIIDCGGNNAGANVLNQFSKLLNEDNSDMAVVVNFNRFETRTVEAAAEHIAAIEAVTGLAARYIINNTHLLTETTAETIAAGHALAVKTAALTKKELLMTTYPEKYVKLTDIAVLTDRLFPVGMHMRETWHDVR
ncbi:MAG: ATP-binding protein [Oscillospiraceae bacterium]|jgi:RecA/RadA recombinase|nr:ATP-binding protein [Oscillospiraceae bacterium]